MKSIHDLLYPELRGITGAERDRILSRARQTPFDTVELLGMAAGLVLVTALTRYGVGDIGAGGRFAMAIINFAVALPLLALVLAPFLWRRTRRGLKDELDKRTPA